MSRILCKILRRCKEKYATNWRNGLIYCYSYGNLLNSSIDIHSEITPHYPNIT